MTKSSFTYGDERFEYEVCFTPERTGRIAVHVHPDASVQIDAPEGETLERIHSAVLKRGRWIRNHVLDARAQREHVLPRSYTSGESHVYLGRRYALEVTQANGTGAQVNSGAAVSTSKPKAARRGLSGSVYTAGTGNAPPMSSTGGCMPSRSACHG